MAGDFQRVGVARGQRAKFPTGAVGYEDNEDAIGAEQRADFAQGADRVGDVFEDVKGVSRPRPCSVVSSAPQRLQGTDSSVSGDEPLMRVVGDVS